MGVMDRVKLGKDLLDSVNELDMITDELEKTVDLWIKGNVGTDILNEMIKTEVLDDLDYEMEISVNTSCCCDEFFDKKLDEGFSDDDEIRRYLNEDSSELLSAMVASFSSGFSIISVLQELGMHTDAVNVALRLADEIDHQLERKTFYDDYVNECLGAISYIIRQWLGEDDPVGWMVRNLDM